MSIAIRKTMSSPPTSDTGKKQGATRSQMVARFSAIRCFLIRTWQYTSIANDLPPAVPQAQLLSKSVASSSCIYAATSLVPKQAYRVSGDTMHLKQQLRIHNKLNVVFDAVAKTMYQGAKLAALPYVPVCLDWYPDIFESEVADSFTSRRHLPRPCAGYAMEYIQPLHHHYLRYLVKRHLSCGVQEDALKNASNTHTVLQVYLGKLRPLTDPWDTNMQGRIIYVDHLYQEGVDFNHFAAAMGSALAVLHWCCGLDAAGVQFLLGGDRRGRIQLWMTGFSHCRPFQRTVADVRTRLVRAVLDGNGMWPRWLELRPYREVWFAFKRAYLHVSLFVFSDKQADSERIFLPLLFLQSLAAKQGPEASF